MPYLDTKDDHFINQMHCFIVVNYEHLKVIHSNICDLVQTGYDYFGACMVMQVV